MKRYINRIPPMRRLITWAMAAMLLAGTQTACTVVEDEDATETAESESAFLNLNFSASSDAKSRTESKGTLKDNETDANPKDESNIKSIRVWVFESGTDDNATPIAYKEDTNLKDITDNYKLSLRFLRKVKGYEIKDIDLYILANAETVSPTSSLSKKNFNQISRGKLKEAVFSGVFGIENNTAQNTYVPVSGLPISRAITHISVDGHVADTERGAASKAIKIPLIRAISKLHFFFARKADGNTDAVEVTKIVVDGNIIPKSSFVFPDEESYNEALANQNATRSYDSNTLYEPDSLNLGGVKTTDIASVDNPLDFKRQNDEAAQAYMERLANNGIKSHDLCYLRETNKAVKGKIYYRLGQGGEEKSQEFSIPTKGNAIRNRELAVYGYFQKGESAKLYVQPIVMDWEDGGSYSFSTSLSINTEITPGKQGADVKYNDAFYGPKLKFTGIETNGKSWVLQTDNPDFGFIYKDKVNEDGSYSLNDVMDVIKGDANTKESKELYIVPKSELDWAKRDNYTCQVFMIAYSPNEKVIINSKDGGTALPGTKTEILFTQVK